MWTFKSYTCGHTNIHRVSFCALQLVHRATCSHPVQIAKVILLTKVRAGVLTPSVAVGIRAVVTTTSYPVGHPLLNHLQAHFTPFKSRNFLSNWFKQYRGPHSVISNIYMRMIVNIRDVALTTPYPAYSVLLFRKRIVSSSLFLKTLLLELSNHLDLLFNPHHPSSSHLFLNLKYLSLWPSLRIFIYLCTRQNALIFYC